MTDRSYWLTPEGRIEEAIRLGLRDAGVQGPMMHLVGPVRDRVMAEIQRAADEEDKG